MKDLQEKLLKLCSFKEIVREIGKVVSDTQRFESLRPSNCRREKVCIPSLKIDINCLG